MKLTISDGKQIEDPSSFFSSRVEQYELIYFNTLQFELNHIMSFNAFNHEFILHLYANDNLYSHLNSISIVQYNIDTKNNIDRNILPINKCHYYGKVEQDSESFVSISICHNRGIRGQIRAFGDEYIVRPSKYYLNRSYDYQYYHQKHDQHLIYKYADIDTSYHKIGNSVHPEINNKFSNNINRLSNNRRKLLAANITNTVEMLLINDPSRIYFYKQLYDSDKWFDELISSTLDIVHHANSYYINTNWDIVNVGSIQLKVKELQLWHTFNGTTSVAQYDFYLSNCTQPLICEIDGSGYLNKFANWLYQYKSPTFYDVAHMLTAEDYCCNSAGWGFLGTVCTGNNNGWSSANIEVRYNEEYAGITMAHELGHNFDMSHDGQGNNCNEAEYVMHGVSSTPLKGFSNCSINYLNNYFINNNLSCLDNYNQSQLYPNPICGNGVLDYTEQCDCGNNDIDCTGNDIDLCCNQKTCKLYTDILYTDNTNTTILANCTNAIFCEHKECFAIDSVFDESINGHYVFSGCYNNKAYYSYHTDASYYLFWSQMFSSWHIFSSLNEQYASVFCSANTIEMCQVGSLWKYDFGNGWESAPDITSIVCNKQNECGNFMVEYTEQCDCGEFYECEFIDECCDPYTCNWINNGNCTSCRHKPCYQAFNFDEYQYSDINGNYTYVDCYNNKEHYFNGIYHLYFSTLNNWHFNTALTDSAVAYCNNHDLHSCDVNWFIYDSGWKLASNATVKACDIHIDYSINTTMNLTHCLNNNIYGNQICINDTNNNNNNNIISWLGEYKILGCKDKYPYYYLSQSSAYYLHYIEYTMNQWIISTQLISIIGQSYCKYSNILNCSSNKWYQKQTNINDEILFVINSNISIVNCPTQSPTAMPTLTPTTLIPTTLTRSPTVLPTAMSTILPTIYTTEDDDDDTNTKEINVLDFDNYTTAAWIILALIVLFLIAIFIVIIYAIIKCKDKNNSKKKHISSIAISTIPTQKTEKINQTKNAEQEIMQD